MNREIKFRAWDGEKMHILENSGLQYYDFEGSYSLGFTVDGYSGFWAHEQYEISTKIAKEFPIMQYTGLKDKNGKEIYEGDIVACVQNKFGEGEHEYWSVEFEEASFVVFNQVNSTRIIELIDGETVFNTYGANYINCEVIGNIYENPELL